MNVEDIASKMSVIFGI